MRNIVKVMDAILEAIPDDYPEKYRIENRFDSVKTSVGYTAPELYPHLWTKVCHALSENIGALDLPWTRVVGEIIRGEREK